QAVDFQLCFHPDLLYSALVQSWWCPFPFNEQHGYPLNLRQRYA
ncbi:uncharacterized protein METZ01_LOCUS123634, partial [marine metagenome]